ncbi:MAG: LCP family protein [Candidatus Dojkabacteria bacterium]|jgi:LCP family protein required for cell wall assembly
MTIDLKDTDIKKTEKVENTPKVVQKPKIKKKLKLWKILLFLILFILLGLGAYYGVKLYKISNKFGFKLDTNTIFTVKEPELKKDASGNFTNVLLVGIDTRENSDLLNTDSIILLSYNYNTKEAVMISIPRDFHVEIDEKTKIYRRINYVYSYSESQKAGSGLQSLANSVAEVTGMEVQYYAMIDYTGFTEIIDIVGGIEVNVENSFTDYMYPKGFGYKTVSFKAGPQIMDGAKALEYSRSRHSSQNQEGTDYARARRQQKVIATLQEKILSNETLANPKKLMEILSSLSDNIKVSEFTQDDVKAAITLGKEFSETGKKAYSFVLDPYSGNFKLIQVKSMESGAFAIGPVLGFGKYDDIKEYVNNIIEKPALYSERATVYIYNTGLTTKEVTTKVKEMQKEYPYINIVQSYIKLGTHEGVTVFPTDTTKYLATTEEFASYFKTENKTKPESITQRITTDGVIVLLGEEVQLSETEE